MTSGDPVEKFYRILHLRGRINRLATAVGGADYPIFSAVSLDKPRFDPPELGFIRAVPWLFIHYYEAGKVGVKFLRSRFEAYNSNNAERASSHYKIVRQLRTYFQHNLNITTEHDREVKVSCENWFRESCGSSTPDTDSEWHDCLKALLDDAVLFMETLDETMRQIKIDESSHVIMEDLRQRIDRYHPPHQFDEIISKAATDIGREHIDVVSFRKRHYDKWTNDLRTLEAGYDFEVEARKRIEHALLTDTLSVLPISGHDIMERLGVPPGPRVGEILEEARLLYDSEPCDAETLLKRLSNNLGGLSD